MNLTQKARKMLTNDMSLDDALPTKMPVYVNSVTYLFGVLTLSALVMLGITGLVLTLFGPGWYHVSSTGHFVHSMHFWGAQVFFGALVLHVLTKFLMAAWRDGRWKTWMAGAGALAVAVFAALTGFLSQTNWDSQWIAVQAKDAMNAVGFGTYFNPMNTGQVLTMHIAVLPFLVLLFVAIHLFFIRRDGPVKPIEHSKSSSK
jgi:quinol-cytochrome oxidoreductase complex cytochrome b subunit